MSDSSAPLYGAVLCAGFGTRMAPITQALPKPLIPFLNTPTITYSLNHLARAGITRVCCNLHHLADTIPPVVDRLGAAMGVEMVYAREWEILGTAGGVAGIWHALGEPEEGTLVIINGDAIMDIDLAEHIAHHRASENEVTLVLREKSPGQPGSVWIDDNQALVGLRHHRRPDHDPSRMTEYEYTGVQILDAAAIRRLSLDPGDIITELHGPLLEEGGKIGGSILEGYWAALDNPSLILENTRQILENPSLFPQAPLPDALAKGLFVYRPGTIDDSVKMKGPVLIGMNASVGAGCRIGPNVILDGVELAPNTVVSNAVLYGMGKVEGEWTDCVAVAGKVAMKKDS